MRALFHNGRNTNAAVTFLATVVVACVMAGCHPKDQRQSIRAADEVDQHTWECYTKGTFVEATNALVAQITYLQAHERELSVARDLDELLYLDHAHLAYMLLYCKDENGADQQFNLAYKRYRIMLAKVPRSKILPRSQFIDYLIAGIGKVDDRTGAAWKRGLALDINFVNRTKLAFADGSKNN